MSVTAKARKAYNNDAALESWLKDTIQQKGLTSYLSSPDFNFIKDLRRRVQSAGFRGHKEDEIVSQIFQELTFEPGSLWKFNTEKRQPLDGFWKTIADNRVKSQIRNLQTERRVMPTVSITPRKDEGDTGGGISEQTLEGRPESITDREEEEVLFGDFREFLSKHREPDRVLKVFDAFMKDPVNMRQKDVAQETGMSQGQVNHWLKEIKQALWNFASYAGEENPTLMQMFKLLEQKSKEPTQPKQPNTGTYVGPSGTEQVPVVIVRRGRDTVTVKRQDGTPFENGEAQVNVPKNQVVLA